MKKAIAIATLSLLPFLVFLTSKKERFIFGEKIYTPDKKFYIQKFSLKKVLPIKDHNPGYIVLYNSDNIQVKEFYVDSLESNPLKVYNDSIISTNSDGPCWELYENGTASNCK